MLSIQQRVRGLSDNEREEYEARAERFEEAIDSDPDIPAYLPVELPLRVLVLAQLAKRDMEHYQGKGTPRRVEDYLQRFPELATDSAAQLDLLLWEYRLRSGSGVSPEDFVKRFPDLKAPFLAKIAESAPAKPWIPPQEYEVETDPIGAGAWGVVFKAHHKVLKCYHALKVVDPHLIRRQTGRQIKAQFERLRDEIPAAARFNHPNIVRLHNGGESNGHPYFAMEYCPEGSLQDKINRGPLAPTEAAELLRTLAQAAQAIHTRGMVHRDLKPSNVLFGEGGVPKIADFGLTLSIPEGQSHTVIREIAGTPAYMAPEQVDPSLTAIDPTTDVYGLGAVLYACLAGIPPTRHGNDLRKTNPRVPLDLDAICTKCLRKLQTDRYRSAQELADDLGRFLAGVPVLARSQPLRRVGHWVRANRWPVLAAAMLAAAFIAFGIYQAEANERDRQIAQERIQQAENLAKLEANRASAEHRLHEAEVKRAETERKTDHVVRVAAAREHALRGGWLTALPEYDRIIQDEEADSVRLRIERLVGYFALNHRIKLVEELDALDRLPLAEMSSQVKLMRSAWLLCDDKRQIEGRALAREALQNPERLFSKADAALAEALAAERVGRSIEALQRAVRENPLHYLSSCSLAIAYAAVGDLEKARAQSQFVRDFFPYSDAPYIADAFVAFIEMDRLTLKTSLAKAAERVSPERRPEITNTQKYLLLAIDLQEISTRISASENGIAMLGDMWNVGLLLGKMQHMRDSPNSESMALPVPTANLAYRRVAEILTTYAELGPQAKTLSASEKSLSRLKVLTDDYPDAGLLTMAATVYLAKSLGPLEAGNIQEVRKNLDQMADLCARALKAPNLLPRSNIRYLARGLGTMADLGVLKLAPDATANADRIRGQLHLLVQDGKNWPKLRQEIIEKYVGLTTAPLVQRQTGEWRLDDSAGKAAFDKRRIVLDNMAKFLVDDWAISEPDNPAIPRLRKSLETWQQSPGVIEDQKAAPIKK